MNKINYKVGQDDVYPKCQQWMGPVHVCQSTLEEDSEIQPEYTGIRRDKSGLLWHMKHIPNCPWWAGQCRCGADTINAMIEQLVHNETLTEKKCCYYCKYRGPRFVIHGEGHVHCEHKQNVHDSAWGTLRQRSEVCDLFEVETCDSGAVKNE